jgi:hypothetical protein
VSRSLVFGLRLAGWLSEHEAGWPVQWASETRGRARGRACPFRLPHMSYRRPTRHNKAALGPTATGTLRPGQKRFGLACLPLSPAVAPRSSRARRIRSIRLPAPRARLSAAYVTRSLDSALRPPTWGTSPGTRRPVAGPGADRWGTIASGNRHGGGNFVCYWSVERRHFE